MTDQITKLHHEVRTGHQNALPMNNVAGYLSQPR